MFPLCTGDATTHIEDGRVASHVWDRRHIRSAPYFKFTLADALLGLDPVPATFQEPCPPISDVVVAVVPCGVCASVGRGLHHPEVHSRKILMGY